MICLDQTFIQDLALTNMESKTVQTKSDIPPKPPCNIVKGYGGRKDKIFNQNDGALLKDNFTISTWLLIGATLQTILFSLPIRPSYALAPAVLLLTYRFLTNLLICFGLKQNPYMSGITEGKHTALYHSSSPDEHNPASAEICVLLLTARCNHPLGLLAPGFKDLAEHFKTLIFDLDANAPANGFLGGSSYANVSDRTTGSELMNVIYFKSYEHLHAFAHEEAHREAWGWWNGMVKEKGYGWLSIGHEVYSVPEGKWQNVYINYHESNFGRF